MDEEWKAVVRFPLYEIREDGAIRSTLTGVIRKPTLNQYGVPKLNLMRDHEVFTASVNHLVAEAFVERPHRDDFNSVIHLDGDKTNCHSTNLMWRPRYFAIQYQQQFEFHGFQRSSIAIMDLKTEEVYERIQNAVMQHGLLFHDIVVSMHEKTYVWPTYQQFIKI